MGERATVPVNRLASATSPYLQQHATNPVDWHEWGPEALELARREDKPIFLSIGYSACHWCHVMAHESFESADVAAVMNRLFVNIKLDREERPDIDEIYMAATTLMNHGQGGWPMSVWLTPELHPFFAGTYFPPESRWGRPGFKQICEQIGELWRTRRRDLEAQAKELTGAVRLQLGSAAGVDDPGGRLTLDDVDRTADMLVKATDPHRGGLISGGTNKFPPSMALDVLLRAAARRRGDVDAHRGLVGAIELTLDNMAAGGIFDHMAGGIHRYSTDRDWLVPHFEKMLYDQGLVSRIYLDAFQYLNEPEYARVARSIFDYVLSDLQSPEGGLYSARDADSEGEEGRYYVWTRREIETALAADAELFCERYGVRESGNWEDPHAPGVPKNVLHIATGLDELARRHALDTSEVERRLEAARKTLLETRSRRVAPQRDEKILVEWNGLMIASLARGGSVLGEQTYIARAARAAEAIWAHQWRDGRLQRSYRDGRVLETAFLSDYANLIDAFIELYEAGFEERWLARAGELLQTAIRWHADEAGGFFFTPADHEQLIARHKDLRDGATPSGNSVMLSNLLRLSVITGDAALRERAERMIAAFAPQLAEAPWSAERFLAGVDFAANGPVEIALIGPRRDPRTQALLRVIHESYLPNRVLLLADGPEAATQTAYPLLSGRTLVAGAPAAYVCRNYTCGRPVTTPEELRRLLNADRR